MRLATLRLNESATRAAVADNGEWVLLDDPDIGTLFKREDWRAAILEAVSDAGRDRVLGDEAHFTRPVLAPSKVICCGLNYRDHILEMGRELPTHPTLFAKFADTLADPNADIVVAGSGSVDWEAELAIVIGSTVERHTPAEQAQRHIAGYTIANDISMRDWQSRTLQWLQGKAWDHSTPIGPVVVTADELSPESGLAISATIDGELVQSSDTRELLFTAPALVSYISEFTRLEPGDLVLTGTPSGVGMGMSPPRFLRDKSTIITSIEGIGELRNTIYIDDAHERAIT